MQVGRNTKGEEVMGDGRGGKGGVSVARGWKGWYIIPHRE